jgi:hypothetical protein
MLHAFSRGRCIVCGALEGEREVGCAGHSPIPPTVATGMLPAELKLLVETARLLIMLYPKAHMLDEAWSEFLSHTNSAETPTPTPAPAIEYGSRDATPR